MEILKELAVEISAIQSGLAAGDLSDLTAQEELNRLRRRIAGIISDPDPEQDIIAGYRADAVSQGLVLEHLLTDCDLHTVPDFTLFHLAACAQLFAAKIDHYFKLRNRRAANRIKEENNG